MKSLKVINIVFALAFTSFVNAQSSCNSKITDKGYKCCSTYCVPVYTDEDGAWGFENNEWCGCGADTINSKPKADIGVYLSKCPMNINNLGYPCCPLGCEVVYTDDDGTWGIDNNEWCGCSPDNDKIEADKYALIEQYNKRVDEILSDDKEIERKWLIDKDKIPYDLTSEIVDIVDIKQTYICFDPEIRVREYTKEYARRSIKSYEMTIKTNLTKDGLIRDEVNIDINKQQYDNILLKKEGNSINKTRYQFLADGEVIAIDIFKGDLEGLAYMEIEFATTKESEVFETPDWVIKDVTDDIRYKNGHLARYGIPDPQ